MGVKPTNISIIQVYAPTADKPLEEMKKCFKDVRQLFKYIRKEQVTIFIREMIANIEKKAVREHEKWEERWIGVVFPGAELHRSKHMLQATLS